MIQLELQPEIESQLAAEAQARGLALDRYIETIVTARRLDRSHPESSQERVAEAIASIRKNREGVTLGGLKIRDLINEGRKY